MPCWRGLSPTTSSGSNGNARLPVQARACGRHGRTGWAMLACSCPSPVEAFSQSIVAVAAPGASFVNESSTNQIGPKRPINAPLSPLASLDCAVSPWSIGFCNRHDPLVEINRHYIRPLEIAPDAPGRAGLHCGGERVSIAEFMKLIPAARFVNFES